MAAHSWRLPGFTGMGITAARGLHVVGVLDWSFGMNEYFEITGKNEELF